MCVKDEWGRDGVVVVVGNVGSGVAKRVCERRTG